VAICSACAKTLLELAVASEPDEMPSGARRLELWDDLRQRVREDDGGETPEDPADNGTGPSSSRRVWAGSGAEDAVRVPSLFRWFFAHRGTILLASCVVLLTWGVWLQLKVGRLAQPHVVDGMAELLADEDAGARGTESGAVAVSAAGRSFVLLGLFDQRGYSRYRVEIIGGASGAKIPLWTSAEVPSLPNGSIILEVPPHFLKPGPHTIRLYGVSGEMESFVAQYQLPVN